MISDRIPRFFLDGSRQSVWKAGTSDSHPSVETLVVQAREPNVLRRLSDKLLHQSQRYGYHRQIHHIRIDGGRFKPPVYEPSKRRGPAMEDISCDFLSCSASRQHVETMEISRVKFHSQSFPIPSGEIQDQADPSTYFDDGEYSSLKRLKIVQCVLQAYAPLANASSEDTYPNDALHSALYRARNSLKYLDIQHLWRDRKAHQPLSKRIDMPALKEVIIPPNHRFNLIAIMIHRLCRLASPYS